MSSQPLVSTNTNTCWIFVAGQPEPRHLFDIVVGVQALRERGVPDASILVFAEHPLLKAHLAPYGISGALPLREITTRIPQLPSFELVVVIVTGHGDGAGISMDAGPSMNPATVLSAVRTCPGMKAGVVILCQCFAGVFHYADADARGLPDLCLLGATNLNPSLSSKMATPGYIKATPGPAPTDWVANVFMSRFFDWLLQPQDVDGDGRSTLMDAYKHASVACNNDLRSLKRTLHTDVAHLQLEVLRQARALASAQDQQQVQQSSLAFLAAEQRLTDAFENLYLHQEPWVLNARLAKNIELPRAIRPAVAPSAPAQATAPAVAPTPATPAATASPAVPP